jgi:hypothetical protein
MKIIVFGFADYGLVGNVFEVAPALTREMKQFLVLRQEILRAGYSRDLRNFPIS